MKHNIEQLIELLKNHDWFYEYSDDMDQWRKGDNERRFIMVELTKIPPSDLNSLLDTHVPNQALKEDMIKILSFIADKDI